MTDTDAILFVVDDDERIRQSLKNLVRFVGLRVEGLLWPRSSWSKLPDVPGCLVLDVRLQGLSGLDLQKRIAEDYDGQVAIGRGLERGHCRRCLGVLPNDFL